MRLALGTFLLFSAAANGQAGGKIVSTAPGFTETLFALGAGPRVAAVSQFCHFPPEVEKLPRVGTYLDPNVEAIVRLQPSLALVHAEQKQAVDQLRRTGVPVLAVRNTTLEDMLTSIRQIGDAVGLADNGVRLQRDLRARLAAVSQRAEGQPRRTLLFVVGRTPGRLDGMIAVGKGSMTYEIIRIAGGRNILDDSPVAYPRISLEGVLRLNPDVIVDMGDMAVTKGVTRQHMDSVVRLWEAQSGVRAAKEKSVHAVAADIFVVPGPRVVEAAEAFARMLRPGSTK